ncbi:MAG: GNAT family N-acetyltransferase [Acidobacteria bacterium]|nr:GNAT family N-acetyltransferase [Acidobacteriota bacterium]
MDDIGAVQLYASDPEVVRFMPWGPNSPAETREFLEKALAAAREPVRTEFEFAVTFRGEEVAIGGAGIRARGVHRRADIGYALRRDVWGRGLATEVAALLGEFGFGALGMHRIEATCDPENRASARVLEKAGMRLEGRMRGHMPVRGVWRDSLLYAVLEEERRPEAT